MKFDQHNFAFVTTVLTEDVESRVQEVVKIKSTIAKALTDKKYRYAIIGEDVTSNDLRISYVVNLIISVVPHAKGTIKLIDEGHVISNLMANAVGDLGYRCMIADEDMMGDIAKEKIMFVPKDDEYESFAQMMKDDKATVPPHWIFSGDDEDPDGYYINCSACGSQRKAYDRNCDLDIPAACPHCAVKMDLGKWEVKDTIMNQSLYLPIYEILVVHEEVNAKRNYTLRLRARSEEEARDKALTEVATKWLHWDELYPGLYIESVKVEND